MNLDILFPHLDVAVNNIEPMDDRVLLQIQHVPSYQGLIQRLDSDKEAEQFQRTLCKVISVGDNAFYSKATGRKWVDIKVGDYVIAPRTSGQRILLKHGKDSVHLLIVEDSSILVRIHNPEQYLDNLVSKG